MGKKKSKKSSNKQSKKASNVSSANAQSENKISFFQLFSQQIGLNSNNYDIRSSNNNEV